MPIKTTNRQIVDGTGSINTLLKSILPSKAAYSVSKLANACVSEQKSYETAREKIFTDAGCEIRETGPDGAKVREWTHDDKEVVEKAKASVNDLLDAEVELNALPLDIDQFGNAELPGNAFTGLDWAIKGA